MTHPRRPRGSQTGREKRRDESFQVRAKEPLGTDSHRTISKNSTGCWLLIGHKNCSVLLCPIDEQFLLSSFRESYRTAIVSMTNAPKKCTQSGKFQFDIKSRSDFKVLSARKLNTLSKNTSLSLQQVFTLESVKSCVNIREFLKDTTTAASHENVAWKSEFTHFFSLYRDNSNSLTLPHASELFWSWISISHIQVHEENEFCHCLFTSFTKHEIRHFHG